MTTTSNVTNTSSSILSAAATSAAASTSTSASTSASSLAADTTDTTGSTSLGKDAFLQLLVTQMQNQDPLNPTDNTAFVAQLAQFSSLEAMQNLETSVDSISSTFQSSQALQASSLVGTTVVVPGTSAVVDTSQGLTGSVVLPAASSTTTVNVLDSGSNLVDTINLGSQAAGTTSFTWNGETSSGSVAPSGTYTFAATDASGTALTTNLPATVSSVTMGTAGAGMTLNLASGSSVALSAVQTVQ